MTLPRQEPGVFMRLNNSFPGFAKEENVLDAPLIIIEQKAI
jgi:hypothetical protein